MRPGLAENTRVRQSARSRLFLSGCNRYYHLVQGYNWLLEWTNTHAFWSAWLFECFIMHSQQMNFDPSDPNSIP